MGMVEITCLPDNKRVDIRGEETILEASLRADVPVAHACGGNARCSTCRIWILDGLDNCAEPTEDEKALAGPLGFGRELRLACQTRVNGEVKFRRLVLDETDLEIASQLGKKRLGPTGESKKIVVLFSDINAFTSFSERLSAYDVMFVLNRYCLQMGEIIERNGGYVDKFIGDGIMALFGVDDDPCAPLRSVNAAVEMLTAVDKLKPYMDAMYDRSFDMRIGLHYGDAVIGNLGSARHGRLTAIGDTVNVASRIEVANKDAGTRLLISEELYEQVKDSVTMEDFVRVKLRGTTERKSLYEISAVDPAALPDRAAANGDEEVRQRFAGLDWVRVLPEAELAIGERKVVERPDFDLLLIRGENAVHACNNACPHLKLPLNDSEVTEDGGIICRWHQSCFDLATGEIRSWANALEADGTSKVMPHLGNISKNKEPLAIFPARIADGQIWVALD